jgi:predicted dehydrogenase
MRRLKGVAIGAGYFAGFQYEAWTRIPEVEIVALSNRNVERARPLMQQYGVRRHYTDWREMIESEKPDFVDVITPPAEHRTMCRFAGELGVHVICQKPLAPTLDEAREIVADARRAGIRFMVHENFRFQPWHRELRRIIDGGAVGDRLHSLAFRMRMGDGWGEDAYLARQPYFREYPRLLIYETGVHLIDTFRYLAGPVERVYARLRKLNPVIAGEDCGLLVFEFESGAVGLWDANRFNEPNYPTPRYTFGEFLVEGNRGAARLYGDGRITLQPLGAPERDHPYRHENRNFAGDCCYTTQRHFIDRLIDGQPFETSGDDYLETLAVQEAAYESAHTGSPARVDAQRRGRQEPTRLDP